MWKPIGAWKKALKLLPVSSKSIKALSGRLNISVSCCNSSWSFSGQDTSTPQRQECLKLLPGSFAKEVSFLGPQPWQDAWKGQCLLCISKWHLKSYLWGLLYPHHWRRNCRWHQTRRSSPYTRGQGCCSQRPQPDGEMGRNLMESSQGLLIIYNPCLSPSKMGWMKSPLREEVGHGCMRRRAELVWGKISLSCSSSIITTFCCGAINAISSRTKTSEKSKALWRHEEIFLLV